MSFPRYPKYKPSGVEWLGDVPEHWVPKKIGEISSLKGRLGWQGLKAEEYRDQGPYVVSSAHFDDHEIQWDECPRVSQERYDTDSAIQLAANDVLLMKDGAAMGKLAFIDRLPGPACLNSHLLLFRPTKIDGADTYSPRFAFFFMQTGYFQEHIKVNGTGATFLGISQEAIGRYQIVLPPLPEQMAIAAFLDRETAKIDGLVAEQRRLVELLKEKRQAVISHAVTKGINPRAAMKPSGIEWLGDVPAHWEVFPMKRDLDFLTSGSRGWAENYSDEGELFIRITNLTRGSINLDLSDIQRVAVPDGAEGSRTKVKPGDVLFSITAYLGSVAVVPEDIESAYVSQHVALARLRQKRLTPRWVGFVALSLVGKTWFETQSYGGTKIQLSLDDVRDLPITAPPISEQHAITAFLDSELAKFDTLTAEAQRAIDLLLERRTALISAAVTGQIDMHST